MRSRVAKRSIVLAGHKTSVSLDDEFWKGLKEVAVLRLTNLSDLIGKIDAQREHGNLSSAIRLFVLDFYRSQVPNPDTGEGLHEIIAHRPLMHA